MAWGLFNMLPWHGVARADQVDILETATASSGRIAMLIERSDHAALSGSDVFVFLTDHPYTVSELRKSLYAFEPVLHVGDPRLSLKWISGSELEIRCGACDVSPETITERKNAQAGIKIRYTTFKW